MLAQPIKTILIDLDGTLHNNDAADKRGYEAVFSSLAQKYPSHTKETLQGIFNEKRHSCGATFEKHAQFDSYQGVRFQAMLRATGIPESESDFCVKEYKKRFFRSLQSEKGAVDTLRTLKLLGYKVVLVSDGFTDKQEKLCKNLRVLA